MSARVTAEPIQYRYFTDSYSAPYWFRTANGFPSGTILWREESWWTQLVKYPTVMDADDRLRRTLGYEDWDRGDQIADCLTNENTGRPSWREAAITRRGDGLTEAFMHDGECYD